MKNLWQRGTALGLIIALAQCGVVPTADEQIDPETVIAEPVGAEPEATVDVADVALKAGEVRPEIWPVVNTKPLDPVIEAQIDDMLAKMTLEQKVGQTIQADTASVTVEDVKTYRLGSVLSGGNSAPGPKAYATTEQWLEMADAYYNASVDAEGVEIAIPAIWGIDAVHGHTNLMNATVFPHNIGLGATRNPDLIEKIARITAIELAVSGHDWTFAPTLAVPRDDRWGRAYEGFAEHPEVAAMYGDRIVYGLQGRPGEDDFMGNSQMLSAAKHFLADGGTENGTDQGDAVITEEELRDIHAAGYIPAIEADVQSVMISFSSWNGVKMTGNKGLVTDVLKDRMGFDGFVVSDWNAHGQIPGCTNADCPQAMNAGVDMYMAPDSWKDIYYSNLEHAKSGVISEERLDEAVRRILRVKLRYGLWDKGAPSTRPLAGDESLLGAPEHRAVARQAVRESMVLLKNNDSLLPLDAGATVLVTGDGADSIAKASGGWTLSWQGKGHSNDEFPNGQSILSGITEVVEAAGGTVIFDPEGTSEADADVVIAVYGEDPYAEFQGDMSHLDFEPNGFDTANLTAFQDRGIPVVSVFLSGRPLWTNPEMNMSDAFVAAWLPGSEGAGVSDMLFRTDPSYEFTGKLSFSWPKDATGATINVGDEDYDPLFAYGYGLTYGDDGNIGTLSEESGLADDGSGSTDVFFTGGKVVKPWSLFARVDGSDLRVGDIPFQGAGVAILGTDRAAQEDSMRIDWTDAEPTILISTVDPVDLTRQTNGALELSFHVKNFGDTPANIGVAMGCRDAAECRPTLPIKVDSNDWVERRIPLSCFAERGADMSVVGDAIGLTTDAVASIGISDIRLEATAGGETSCGDQ